MAKAKILVVDDEADIVESIRFNLELEGYEVITAADGAGALERARREHPDLIVMDVMMPIENGYRVARHLMEDYAAGRLASRIPTILVTARNLGPDSERERIFMDFSHVDAMIYKPFAMDDLIGRIQALLERGSSLTPSRLGPDVPRAG